jgi:hypothetical protein
MWFDGRSLGDEDGLTMLCSQSIGRFDDAEMPHKKDELLQAAWLPTDIDVILNSTGDSAASHPPHFPYENAEFTTILDNVSIIT